MMWDVSGCTTSSELCQGKISKLDAIDGRTRQPKKEKIALRTVIPPPLPLLINLLVLPGLFEFAQYVTSKPRHAPCKVQTSSISLEEKKHRCITTSQPCIPVNGSYQLMSKPSESLPGLIEGLALSCWRYWPPVIVIDVIPAFETVPDLLVFLIILIDGVFLTLSFIQVSITGFPQWIPTTKMRSDDSLSSSYFGLRGTFWWDICALFLHTRSSTE